MIFDAIHDNVATKADLVDVRHEIAEFGVSLRGEMARLEHRLLTRLGGLVVVVAGLLLTVLHDWSPAVHG